MPTNKKFTPKNVPEDLITVEETTPVPSVDEAVKEEVEDLEGVEMQKPLTSTPEEPKDSGITLTATESKPVQEKLALVRVKPKMSYHTSIGGTWYYFEKGVCQNVPENVKRIMAEGDMILPL